MLDQETKSEVISLVKEILSQVTEGQTSAQMTGQRVDRTDTVDVGGDETKRVATAAQAIRAITPEDVQDVAAFRSTLRFLTAQTLSNLVASCNNANQGSVTALNKEQENLTGVNMTDLAETVIAKIMASAGKV